VPPCKTMPQAAYGQLPDCHMRRRMFKCGNSQFFFMQVSIA